MRISECFCAGDCAQPCTRHQIMDQQLRTEINQLHARLCSGIGDPNRIALLYELSAGAKNVTSLVSELAMPQSTVSRHLRILRDRHLVTTHRQGQMVYYELTDPRVVEALDLLRAVLHERLEQRAELVKNLSGNSKK